MSLQTARSLLADKLQTAAKEFGTYITSNNLYQDDTVKYTNYYLKCINDLLETLKEDNSVELFRIRTRDFAIKCGTFSSQLIMYSDESTVVDLYVKFNDNMGGVGKSVNMDVHTMLSNMYLNTLDDLTEEQRRTIHDHLCCLVNEEQI